MKFRDLSLAIAALVMLSPGMSYAASSSSTLGDLVQGAGVDLIKPLTICIVTICYLLAFYLVGVGLIRIRDATSPHHGHDKTVMSGIYRLIAGGAFAALPDILGSGMMTFFGAVTGEQTLDGTAPGAVSDCLASTSSTDSTLTCVAQNIGINLVPVGIKFMFAGAYIVGLCMIANTIHKMATQPQGGHHGSHQGKNFAKLMMGTVCCALPSLISAIAVTLGYGTSSVISPTGIAVNTSSVPSVLSYTGDGSTGSTLTSLDELISWLFVILVMFGVASIIRGLMHLNASIDGGGGKGGMTSGMTHIVGGVLLTNGKLATCKILMTFVGSGMGFCS